MSKVIVQKPIVHIPTVKLYKVGRAEIYRKLDACWPWKCIDLEDIWYFHPCWEDWDKIFQYVQKDLPKYVPDTWDCDNFAMYISVLVALNFKCNVCARVKGNMPQGRHKWNVFYDGDDFYQLESQKYTPPDKIADLDDKENGYIPDEIEMG